jgi:hypothetical protein
VRISRGRLLLRAVLLLVGGGFMLWRAWEARLASRALAGTARLLPERIALVEALVGLLALLTGVAALLQLRRRERRHSLHLRGEAGPPPPRDAPGP